jgi:hypothetical protein
MSAYYSKTPLVCTLTGLSEIVQNNEVITNEGVNGKIEISQNLNHFGHFC